MEMNQLSRETIKINHIISFFTQKTNNDKKCGNNKNSEGHRNYYYGKQSTVSSVARLNDPLQFSKFQNFYPELPVYTHVNVHGKWLSTAQKSGKT